MKPAVSLLAVFLTGCVSADVAFECPNGELLCDVLEITADRRPLASGVDLTGVYVYQTTEYALYRDQAMVPDPGPVVEGRRALFRVTVEPHDDWTERDLTGRLYFYQDGVFYGAFQDDIHLTGASDLSKRESTLNFEVPGELLTGDLSWEVNLLEADADAKGSGSEGENMLGPYELPLVDTMGGLRLFLLPIEYNADGSGRLPVTTDDQIETYRRAMMAHYGVPYVEIEVGQEPFSTSIEVQAGGGGWSNLLSAVGDQRSALGVDDDVYIYGLFCPTDSPWAGVWGLSNLAGSAGDVWARASIGLGFAGEGTAGTMVHEVGHAHGRSHTDGGCGAQGCDPAYPYEGGYIGNRGWDDRSDSLIEPEGAKDYMSYCDPTFASDWTYEATMQRVIDVNEMFGSGGTARVQRDTWHTLYLHSDGSAEWGADRPVVGLPGIEGVEVELLDAQGEVVSRVEGRFAPWDHVAGGVVTFRPVLIDYDAVRVNGVVIER